MAREWRQIPGIEHAYDRLREVVASGEAIAFVGAGASAELYPVWTALVRRLADEAVNQGLATDEEHAFWLAATTRPQQAVRGIKQALGDGAISAAPRARRPCNVTGNSGRSRRRRRYDFHTHMRLSRRHSKVGVDPKVTGLIYVATLAREPGEDVGKLAQQYPTPAVASIHITHGFAQLYEAGIY